MNYFFIGIKGSGMSALALVLKGLGNNVLGSDIPKHFFTEKKLMEENIEIYNFGDFDFKKIDKVILGNSFDETNIDFKKAQQKSIEIVKYYDALNEIVSKYDSVAVCGANGKTTTTGLMVSSHLDNPTSYLIGDGQGLGLEKSNKFFFEACEYKNTFLNYTPNIILINNIVYDHPDFFRDIDDMINSFQMFANRCQTLVINGDDVNCQKIEHGNKNTFGFLDCNDLYAKNVLYTSEGIDFTLVYKQKKLGEYKLPFFGEYMLLNSLGVIMVNLLLNRDVSLVINNLKEFKGVKRRFSETILNKSKNTILIDDYAHHPTAIKETLKAIRQKYPHLEIISVFQAHTQARAETFGQEFADELVKSDKVVIIDTFKAVREKENQNKKYDNIIYKKIEKINKDKLINIEALDKLTSNFVVCLFGAGDIDLLYKEKIIKKFKGD